MDIKQLIGSIVETCIKIIVVVFVVMFVYKTAIKAYDYGYRIFAEEPMTFGEGRTISIYVEEEDSVKDIGNDLQEKGLIRDANLFYIQTVLLGYSEKIQPGIYDLNTSMRTEEMLEIMAENYVEEDEAEGENDSK